jgi:hypothetical protein
VLKLEIMVETTLSILDEHGSGQLQRLLDAAQGRCVAAHFGTYDYTAGCNVTAAYQKMAHEACVFARQMMQIAFAGTGIFLSDGATNVMPIGSPDSVKRAWKLHFDDVQSSLRLGFFQGWDLHPAQLPTRYAALYDFFLAGSSWPPSGSRTSWPRPGRRRSSATCSTTPRPGRGCSTSSCARSTRARSARTRSWRARG